MSMTAHSLPTGPSPSGLDGARHGQIAYGQSATQFSAHGPETNQETTQDAKQAANAAGAQLLVLEAFSLVSMALTALALSVALAVHADLSLMMSVASGAGGFALMVMVHSALRRNVLGVSVGKAPVEQEDVFDPATAGPMKSDGAIKDETDSSFLTEDSAPPLSSTVEASASPDRATDAEEAYTDGVNGPHLDAALSRGGQTTDTFAPTNDEQQGEVGLPQGQPATQADQQPADQQQAVSSVPASEFQIPDLPPPRYELAPERTLPTPGPPRPANVDAVAALIRKLAEEVEEPGLRFEGSDLTPEREAPGSN
ncbi:MAG: hypothetical protein AAGG72_09715, partial [Pseudomonadota bacterium]